MSKFFDKDFLVKCTSFLFILSIFLDLHVFYNSISTLIRVFFITGIFLIIFFKYATKSEKKLLISYFLALNLFLIGHILNISNNNIFNEFLYFLKMSMNVLIIFTIYKLSYDKKIFYRTILISNILISGSIIVCNLFKIGYTSYDFNKISYNIFDWYFAGNVDFRLSSTKGLFHLTNQISAILCLYLPLLLIKLKGKINFINIFSVSLNIIALFMLGTRVSTYTSFIVIFIAIIGYCLTQIFNKKFNFKYLFLLILFFGLSCIIYINCPLKNRIQFYNDKKNEILNSNESKKSGSDRVITHAGEQDSLILKLKSKEIPEEFYLEYYPIDEDREFYENYVLSTGNSLNDTRHLERAIIQRVKDKNDNKLDDFFGIGYDRIMNIFNIENDFIMQYYSVGIIGTFLLIGVYIIIILFISFKTLFNLRRYFTLENGLLLFSEIYFLICSFFTGNILNSISTIIPLSFVLGYHISIVNKKEKKEYEYVIGFKTSLKSEDEIIKDVFDSKGQVIIYNINPLILMNFYKDKKVVKEFNEQNFNIPDGNGVVLTSRLSSGNINKSIPGIEMFENICSKSVNKKYKIYLYGAKEDSVVKTKKVLENKYKGINIIGYKNGYTNSGDVINDILNKKPDILFVALGSPLQENFIINNKTKLKDIKIIMPVGGSFDVVSNNISRAPLIYRKLKIEFLYRMIKEPKRFRQLFTLVKYLFIALFGNVCYNSIEAKENMNSEK